MTVYNSGIWQLRGERASVSSHPAYRPSPDENASEEEREAYWEWQESLPDDDVSEQNKLLLLKLVRHLATVFPVWRLEIDPALLPDVSAFPDGPLFSDAP